jgi:PAS domain S-box-containing protein
MGSNVTKRLARWLRDRSPGALVRQARRPGQVKIGVRLTVCFVIIVLLMAASHAFTLWQFERVQTQEKRMHDLDQESQAVLSMHASLLILRDKLADVATTEDAQRFAAEAGALRRDFLDKADQANRAVRNQPTQVERDPTMLNTLETIQSALPAQIVAATNLAAAGDWPAVRLRLQNQVGPLSSLTSALVEKVGLEVAGERAQAQESIQRLQQRVFLMNPLAAFLTLLLAGILGTMVTRSITQPLAQLDASAQALAQGNFQHPVVVEGEDELATLGRVFNDATHRLSALYGALQASEERFRTVVATAPVGIAVLDESSTIRVANSRFLEIVGLTAEQVHGMRLNHPSLAVFREDGTPCPTAERPSQRAIATGKPVLDVVLKNLHPVTGDRRWVLTSAWPLLREDGSVYQVIVAMTDITGQKKVEEELRAGRELLVQAQRAAHLGCFDLDLRNNTVILSAELADLFGLTPGASGAFSGRHQDWEALVLPDDLARANASFAETTKTGESLAEYRIRRRSDSEVRWVESRARAFFDQTGQPFRLIGVTMDITDRKSAEQALRRSEEEFRIIFDHAAFGMVLVDPSGYLLRSNPAFRSMMGYTEQELSTLTFSKITHPEDVTLSQSLYDDVIAGRLDRYQVKKRYVRKDGEVRRGRLTVSALRVGSGELQYCVSMVEDITSQELAEHTLLQMSDRLLRIQEEEQRRIAREVHDSTSQEMTALTLNLGALRASQHEFPEKERKQIAESLALAKRVAREIRTFSYLLHPPMLNELGLWAALRMFVEEFKERSGLRVSVEISKDVEESPLHVDQEMALFRFVQEALANVHRHSGSKTATVSVLLKNRLIEASVTDTGRGLAPALLKEIHATGGLAGGVGIPGMHERIGYIGGQLEIRSDENGTTVTALVPIEHRSASSDGVLEQHWPGPPLLANPRSE